MGAARVARGPESATLALAWLVWLTLGGLAAFLIREAWPALAARPLRAWLGAVWSPETGQYGLLPLLAGSGWVTAVAPAVAVPIGLGAALCVAEFTPPRRRRLWQAGLTLAGGIPSVLYGYAGSVWLAPAVAAALGGGSGYTALTAGLVVGLMVMPLLTALSLAALRAVPAAWREAALALGATPWEAAVTVVWPAARRGLAAAVTAACARAAGETMAVLMLAGNSPAWPGTPAAPARTLTAAVAAEMGEAVAGSAHYHGLFMAAAVLLLGSLGLQLAVQALLRPAPAP